MKAAEPVNQVVDALWQDYREKVPDARRIELALREKGEFWEEDHVAFRCLPGTPCEASTLQSFFESLGYERRDSYRFEEKKLNAFWLQPPLPKGGSSLGPIAPKIFISELDLDSFSASDRQRIAAARDLCLSQMRPSPGVWSEAGGAEDLERSRAALTFSSVQSPLSFAEYTELRELSEYAAWTLVYGVCVNHFTVSVHLMRQFRELQKLNEFVKEKLGIPLNTAGGGEIKGDASLKLEQSATLAAPFPVKFADGERSIPYAFIEFAYRHPLNQTPDTTDPAAAWHAYYQGFVAANADKIFSSTDVRDAPLAK